MKRISIDNGKTFVTPEEALTYVVFDRIIAAMDEDLANQVNAETPGGSIFDMLRRYLEIAKEDLIIDAL